MSTTTFKIEVTESCFDYGNSQDTVFLQQPGMLGEDMQMSTLTDYETLIDSKTCTKTFMTSQVSIYTVVIIFFL